MTESRPDSPSAFRGEILPQTREIAGFSAPNALPLTAEGAAALEAAEDLARNASAPATLRAYKADWIHFSQWCSAKGFVPVPAAPAVVGAYLASLAETHSPATIRRRLSALGKMHRYNDLPWNAAHGAIQGPLQGLLRRHGRPPRKAAALSLAMLRQLVATCDRTARGRRDRALLLFGFAGALRRSELVALQVEDVKGDAGRFVQNCTLAAQPGNKGRKDSLTPAWARATSNRLPLKLVLQQGFERQIPLVQRQGQTLPHTLVCERAICGRQMA